MSDYLNNLVAKTLNRVEVVQPRLTSLFEPPSIAGGLVSRRVSLGSETAHTEPLSSETLLETPQTAQAPARNSLESRPPTIDLNRPPDVLQQQLGTDKSMGRHPEQYLAQPAPTSVQIMSTRPEVVRPSDTKKTQPLHPSMPLLVPVATEHEAEAAPPVLERNIRDMVDEQVALPEAERSQDIRRTVLVSPQVIRPAEPAPVAVPRHETPVVEPAAQAAAASIARPEWETIIKITIGRVDVRAVMSAPPAPRPAPARSGPSLSLEDYLKQREGGRR